MVAQVDASYIKARPSKLISRLVSYALFEGRPVTTRGQWINPLLFAHFMVEKRLPQLKQVKQPVFILGTGRSGTTILGVVLSMHRDVGFLNEPKAMWHAIYPEEDVIGSYSRGLARYRIEATYAGERVKRNAHRLFGAYLTTVFSRRLVDKYPELIFRVPFVREIFPDAKFIFLVRNGWDTCASIDKWSERLGELKNGETHDWWGINKRKWKLLVEQLVPEHADLAPHAEEMLRWTKHTDMAAVEWIVTMREGLKLEKEYPTDILRVTYEELCESTNHIIRNICEFTSLGRDAKFIEYAERTLQPVAAKEAFSLDPAIEQPFRDTMELMGYNK